MVMSHTTPECPLCGQETHGPLLPHLKSAHRGEYWGDEGRPPRKRLSDAEAIGDGRRTLYALGIWPTPVVSRATLRALLPPGQVRDVSVSRHLSRVRSGATGRKNRTTDAFQKVLVRLERWGLIERGTEFILIRDQRSILDLALDGIHNPSHEKFLHIQRAAKIVAEEIAHEKRPNVHTQRSRELAFIKSLMAGPASARGVMRSGTQSVRFVPKGRI